jgi:adenylylsulfate kinase
MNSKIILIMGLSGSGKTTTAKTLHKELSDSSYFNADNIRSLYNDWDFSIEGRLRQATRMNRLARYSGTKYVILDFICPLEKSRDIIEADFVVWMDTVCCSKYIDTDKVFTPPTKTNIVIKDYKNIDILKIRDMVI